jgi:TPP-dependent pyruvate/acetoin dehydrogenase alpha subunit
MTNSLLMLFLEKMLLIRQFESKVAEFARKGIFRGSIHFSTGEEATAVGSCLAVEAHDYILPTHRGHGQELAKGCDPSRLMAEIIGKRTGLCQGRGGTLHIIDREHNILGAQAILGAQFPIAIGVGLAIKRKGLAETTVLCFTGDGTTNTRNFYEALGAASHWKLPVIFVCVNNVYAMGTKYEETCSTEIVDKGRAFNLLCAALDGNDVEKVYLQMREIVRKVKQESTPALVELRTYRISGHSVNDRHSYRTEEEIEAWRKKDPVDRLTNALIRRKASLEEIESVRQRVIATVATAEKFALESPYPEWDESVEL